MLVRCFIFVGFFFGCSYIIDCPLPVPGCIKIGREQFMVVVYGGKEAATEVRVGVFARGSGLGK